MRAGVGYSLADQSAALARLSRNYQPFVQRARQGPALRIALAGPDGAEAGAGAGTGDFAALASGADTFAGWVAAMKTQIRDRTGGSRPATPARTATEAQAAPAA